ncbi:MAG: HlyC/CorC family transporter [Planctomycetes bacterium]|nr:HlyC/CorC family transporter [Planctomycetota bacterium]
MSLPSIFDSILSLLSIPFFVLLNGFFVAAEFSLVTVRHTRIEELIRQGESSASTVKIATKNLDAAIAATQLGITISSLALGWLGEPALAEIIIAGLGFLPGIVATTFAHSVAIIIAFAFITFIHVVLGELAPKSLALQHPEQTSLSVVRPLLLFEKIFHPVIWLMNETGRLAIRWLGLKPPVPYQSVHSAEELKMLVSESYEAGRLGEQQTAMLSKVFVFPRKTVQDIMIPRERIAALELNMPAGQILQAVEREGYTRYPVYHKELDNTVGIVHAKDIYHITSAHGIVILYDLLRDPYIVSPTLTIGRVLREFQRRQLHMAIVCDKGGKVVGIVTLEDILEEIVGEIADEYDLPTLD